MGGEVVIGETPPISWYPLFRQHDPTAILATLDAILHNEGRDAKSAETLIFFSVLLEKYPYPIVVNTALLKLADFYCGTNNFLRCRVWRVFQQASGLLDKVINLQELLDRISETLYSNDPMTRAITLRLLGSIAPAVTRNARICQTLRRTVAEGADGAEWRAALFAAQRLTLVSPSFAASMLPVAQNLLHSLEIPPLCKIRVIWLCAGLVHEQYVVDKTWALLNDVLREHPTYEFVVAITRARTKLASHSVQYIVPCTELLIALVKEDPRRGLVMEACKCLCRLLQVAQRLRLPSFPASRLLTTATEALQRHMPDHELVGVVVRLLSLLFDKEHVFYDDEHQYDTVYIERVVHSARVILCTSPLTEARMFATSILLDTLPILSPTPEARLKSITDTAQLLCSVIIQSISIDPEERTCNQASECMSQALLPVLARVVKEEPSLCTLLCSLALELLQRCEESVEESSYQDEARLAQFDNLIYSVGRALDAVVRIPAATLVEDQVSQFFHFLTPVSVLPPRAKHGMVRCLFTIGHRTDTARDFVDNLRVHLTTSGVLPSQPYYVYGLGKQALLDGYVELASALFEAALDLVDKETIHFWLTALLHLANCIQFTDDVVARDNALDDAILALQATVTPSNPLRFQIRFLHLVQDLHSGLPIQEQCDKLIYDHYWLDQQSITAISSLAQATPSSVVTSHSRHGLGEGEGVGPRQAMFEVPRAFFTTSPQPALQWLILPSGAGTSSQGPGGRGSGDRGRTGNTNSGNNAPPQLRVARGSELVIRLTGVVYHTAIAGGIESIRFDILVTEHHDSSVVVYRTSTFVPLFEETIDQAGKGSGGTRSTSHTTRQPLPFETCASISAQEEGNFTLTVYPVLCDNLGRQFNGGREQSRRMKVGR